MTKKNHAEHAATHSDGKTMTASMQSDLSGLIDSTGDGPFLDGMDQALYSAKTKAADKPQAAAQAAQQADKTPHKPHSHSEQAAHATHAKEAIPEAKPTMETAAKPMDAEQAQAAPQNEVQQLEAKVAEHYDALLRARAECENVRRRAQEDIVKAHKYAVERFARELLAVRDSLEAALSTSEQTIEKFQEGVALTLKQLTAAFDKSDLQEVNPLNSKFDPNFHQAIGMVESDLPANTVVSVLQKGYNLSGRVLRPAMVTVAKAKSS